MKKKSIALLMAAVMLFGIAVGGTIAWLTAETTKVENTFTFGDIDIVLDETDTDNSGTNVTTNGRDKANAYNLIPGATEIKDPKVTISEDSEKCYVFVKINVSNNSKTITVEGKTESASPIIEFGVDSDNWIPVAAGSDIYVYTAGTNAAAIVDTSADTETNGITTESVLLAQYGDAQDKNIRVNTGLTEKLITAIGNNTPVITFDACAVQSENNTLATAIATAQELLAQVE